MRRKIDKTNGKNGFPRVQRSYIMIKLQCSGKKLRMIFLLQFQMSSVPTYLSLSVASTVVLSAAVMAEAASVSAAAEMVA